MKHAFHSGFVSIIGRPNVGKSTLLNRIIGEKIAIVSSKPQTTRYQVTGIYGTADYQIIFVDTPGIHQPKNKLGTYMVNTAYQAFSNVDCILFLIEPSEEITLAEQKIIDQLKTNSAVPVLLVINKIDTVKKDYLLKTISIYSQAMKFAAIIPISALKNDGMNELLNEIKQFLPEGPKYFPDDMITDQPERQIISEIIREKALRLLQKEVPHGIAVEIERMEEGKNTVPITAILYCEKDSHKAIIIGKNGSMLKKIGSSARIEIEKFLGNKVYLELWVKVKNDWRNSEFYMRNFGFENKN